MNQTNSINQYHHAGTEARQRSCLNSASVSPCLRGKNIPRRGMTISDALTAIILLSAFSLVAVRLFTSCMKTTEQVQRSSTLTARYDHAISLLRQDVSNAVKMDSPNPSRVTIQTPEKTIKWFVESEELIRDDQIQYHWKELPGTWTFKASPPLLQVNYQPVGQPDPVCLTLFSRKLLAQGNQP